MFPAFMPCNGVNTCVQRNAFVVVLVDALDSKAGQSIPVATKIRSSKQGIFHSPITW